MATTWIVLAVAHKEFLDINLNDFKNDNGIIYDLKNAIKDKKVEAKEALELVKKNSTSKFDESIDVSLNINLKHINKIILLKIFEFIIK